MILTIAIMRTSFSSIALSDKAGASIRAKGFIKNQMLSAKDIAMLLKNPITPTPSGSKVFVSLGKDFCLDYHTH
jgi:hypothetical protein